MRSRALTGLFVLGLFYTAYFARQILIPIALALVLNLLLSPLSRWLAKRFSVPQPITAGLVVIFFFAILGFGLSALSGPAADWMVKLPEELALLRNKLSAVGGAVQEVQQAAKQVQDFAEQTASTKGGSQPLPVVVKGPSLAELFFGQTVMLSAGVFVTVGCLLFLLAAGDNLLRQAVTIAPGMREKKRVVEIAHETEDDISHYLVAISLINAGKGAATGLAMWALGMPNPALWGVMVALLNFIPFLGWLASIAILTLVSVITFDSPFWTLVPPAVFLVIHYTEAQFVAPFFVARRLFLSPLAVFLSLIIWSWMWGIPGTLLAVPLLSIFKIVCERVDGLRPVAMLLTHPKGLTQEKAVQSEG